jgi:hypothetical protein
MPESAVGAALTSLYSVISTWQRATRCLGRLLLVPLLQPLPGALVRAPGTRGFRCYLAEGSACMTPNTTPSVSW